MAINTNPGGKFLKGLYDSLDPAPAVVAKASTTAIGWALGATVLAAGILGFGDTHGDWPSKLGPFFSWGIMGGLWAVACSSVGVGLGFLFGIPRSSPPKSAQVVATASSAPDAALQKAQQDVDAAQKAADDASAKLKASPDSTDAQAAVASTTAALKAARDAADALKQGGGANDPTTAGQDTNSGQGQGAASGGQPAASVSVNASRTGVNTNLEEISDWLTKIIVGVTLTQIPKILAHLHMIAQIIAGSFGGDSRISFAYALMTYFSVSGFLGGYLLTRLYLQKVF